MIVAAYLYLRRAVILKRAEMLQAEADKINAERKGYENTGYIGKVYEAESRRQEGQLRIRAMVLEASL